ncbi:MAG: hypothetical protein KC410_15000 [Anaerolineales bacterium]|uniref:hypothetical protein n=1 Tax=Promineifilum sp. TaxID=2664178 RepID=UPI001DC6E15B|nr:hypothetical protein [Anaerolineales bacterium]MCO5181037.1 hypothetical protein [Promineifilum sp.]
MNRNETIVVAAFVDEVAVESAIETLREWDKRVDEVKLGNIATVWMSGGEIKTNVVSSGLLNRSVPISKDALRVLAQELGNSVAVVVACGDYEAAMVSDSLVRSGGRILANTASLSSEETAKQQQEIAQALEEDAVKAGVEKVKRDAVDDVKRPI